MKICKTRAKKIELQKTYAEKNREVKRSARKDQRHSIDNLTYLAEEATRKGNLKEMFTITKVLSKRQMQRNRPIRAIDGTLMTNTKEQLQRWQEHFSKILNPGVDKQIVEEEEENEECVTNSRINTKAPSVIEIKKSVVFTLGTTFVFNLCIHLLVGNEDFLCFISLYRIA